MSLPYNWAMHAAHIPNPKWTGGRMIDRPNPRAKRSEESEVEELSKYRANRVIRAMNQFLSNHGTVITPLTWAEEYMLNNKLAAVEMWPASNGIITEKGQRFIAEYAYDEDDEVEDY